LLSFSNNANTETEVFHWFKTKTKCQIFVPGERKKTDRLQISKTIIRHKSVLYCWHFCERQVFLCKAQNSFDGWKYQEVENSPVFRYSSHFTSNQHHFALNLDVHFVFLWGKVWSFVFSQPEKGQIVPRSKSTIDYNRYRSVKRVSESTFQSPAVSFSRAFICW